MLSKFHEPTRHANLDALEAFITRNGVAIIHESRDDASRDPEYPVPLGTVDLQARRPRI